MANYAVLRLPAEQLCAAVARNPRVARNGKKAIVPVWSATPTLGLLMGWSAAFTQRAAGMSMN